MLRSGSGYLSANELVLTFGLGARTQADDIELRWPSGQVDHLSKVAAGQTVTVREGGGIVAQRPYGAAPSPVRTAAGSRRWKSRTMKPVTQQSAVELLRLLRESKISALELADEYIAQIERLNPRAECFRGFRSGTRGDIRHETRPNPPRRAVLFGDFL